MFQTNVSTLADVSQTVSKLKTSWLAILAQQRTIIKLRTSIFPGHLRRRKAMELAQAAREESQEIGA
jgi:hypothetical protein